MSKLKYLACAASSPFGSESAEYVTEAIKHSFWDGDHGEVEGTYDKFFAPTPEEAVELFVKNYGSPADALLVWLISDSRALWKIPVDPPEDLG